MTTFEKFLTLTYVCHCVLVFKGLSYSKTLRPKSWKFPGMNGLMQKSSDNINDDSVSTCVIGYAETLTVSEMTT